MGVSRSHQNTLIPTQLQLTWVLLLRKDGNHHCSAKSGANQPDHLLRFLSTCPLYIVLNELFICFSTNECKWCILSFSCLILYSFCAISQRKQFLGVVNGHRCRAPPFEAAVYSLTAAGKEKQTFQASFKAELSYMGNETASEEGAAYIPDPPSLELPLQFSEDMMQVKHRPHVKFTETQLMLWGQTNPQTVTNADETFYGFLCFRICLKELRRERGFLTSSLSWSVDQQIPENFCCLTKPSCFVVLHWMVPHQNPHMSPSNSVDWFFQGKKRQWLQQTFVEEKLQAANLHEVKLVQDTNFVWTREQAISKGSLTVPGSLPFIFSHFEKGNTSSNELTGSNIPSTGSTLGCMMHFSVSKTDRPGHSSPGHFLQSPDPGDSGSDPLWHQLPV